MPARQLVLAHARVGEQAQDDRRLQRVVGLEVGAHDADIARAKLVVPCDGEVGHQPATTFGLPLATDVQPEIESPTRPQPRPLTNTVELPDAMGAA